MTATLMPLAGMRRDELAHSVITAFTIKRMCRMDKMCVCPCALQG